MDIRNFFAAKAPKATKKEAAASSDPVRVAVVSASSTDAPNDSTTAQQPLCPLCPLGDADCDLCNGGPTVCCDTSSSAAPSVTCDALLDAGSCGTAGCVWCDPTGISGMLYFCIPWG